MVVQPYLFFDGRCEEALAFYGKALGGQVQTLVRFKESPQPTEGCGPGEPNGEKIMHASIRVGQSLVNLSDGECGGQPDFRGFSLVLNAKDDDEARHAFEALQEGGGEATMPLSSTFFASSFGMLRDRFGVNWMVMSPPK
ncbi:MAG TPA: glyoxalase/bleomycin resistance/extradiol dioxygenase family protein [Dyella sp.]|uniref:VOC family protein n=1 Tax=Dyella sp. TaxID=1869338 RepID=UPI002D766D56|nr:glyoxalase/bleomycin resistance/extradiol dioxygenase family protein [Dyella sp.]HET6553758.1 glyoxalase/bleomycin resistance/extradiol dioxygenase family protein [Dyella sp.]